MAPPHLTAPKRASSALYLAERPLDRTARQSRIDEVQTHGAIVDAGEDAALRRRARAGIRRGACAATRSSASRG